MAILRTGRNHRAKKELFQKGLQRGFLTVEEIETSLPPGALTAAERWLLYYSLRAAEVEIRDELGASVGAPRLSEEEFKRLSEEPGAQSGELQEYPSDGPSADGSTEPRERSDEGPAQMDPAPSHHV